MDDKIFETDRAIIRFKFRSQTDEEREKVFRDIAQACYELCKYEYQRGIKTNEDSALDS